LAVEFSGRRFEWTFLLAKVNFAILGVDFLKHFYLIVDLAANQIVDAVSLQRFAAGPPAATDAPPESRGLFAAIEATPHSLQRHLQGVPVSGERGRGSTAGQAQDGASHTDRRPRGGSAAWIRLSWRLPRPSFPSWRKTVLSAVFQQLVCTSTHGDEAGTDMVALWRLPPVEPRHYARLLPNIQDLSSRLHGCSIFSKVDLRKGYFQIPVQEGDILKTAVMTLFGLWEFLRMPFGLHNASQSFQRFMDEVLSGLDFAFCYLDDILIGSSSTEEHLHHLHLVLQRLQEYGLVLNMEKCELACQDIDFLGHHITAERGIADPQARAGDTGVPSAPGQEAAPDLLRDGEFL
jgi:hypothetical protein